MNSVSCSALRPYLLAVVVIAGSAFAWAQKPAKNSAPAPHPSAPAHNSAPSHAQAPAQHPNAAGQNRSQGGNANRPGNNNMNRPGNNNMNRPGNNNMNRPGNSGNAPGHNGGNSNMNRPGNNANGRTGGNMNGRNGNANGNMNRNGGNAGGRNGGNAGHPGTANAGRGGPGGRGPTNHVAPGRQVSLRGGGSAHIRPNGQIRSVNRNGMHIERGVRGERRVVSNRNGMRVVSVGHRGGYVQRAYVTRGGRSYYSRTYYYHGAYRSGVYQGYYYGGRPYYGYYPAYYYQPVYYGWAYNPWPAPAPYAWGWGGSPWYGYYGPYYQPYPVYPSAAFWLTDFMVAATLQAAYEAQANAWLGPNVNDGGTLVASLMPIPAAAETTKLSPEIKQALADEVKATLAVEQAEAAKGKSDSASSGGQPAQSNEAPPALDPKFRVFLVSSDMSLVPGEDQECQLSQGDVIQRTTETPDDDGNVNVKVVGSTKNDCAVGSEGPVSTDDLQEMYNAFRESLKDGMGELAKKQGTGGLPKAPDTSTVNGDVPAPPPDKSVEKALQEQQSSADQTENEVKQEAGSGGGGL